MNKHQLNTKFIHIFTSFVESYGISCDTKDNKRYTEQTVYSTVTDLAKFLGKSTSTPCRTAK